MKKSTRHAVTLLLLQAQAAAFYGSAPGQRRPRVPTPIPTTSALLRGQSKGRCVIDRIHSHGSNKSSNRRRRSRSSSTTALQGWFDNFGSSGSGGGNDKDRGGGKSNGAKKYSGSGSSNRGGGQGGSKNRPNPPGKPKSMFGTVGSGVGGGSGSKKSKTGDKNKNNNNAKEKTTDLGASAQALATAAGETLAAAGETAVAAFDSVQERLSEALPQNVTLIWGGGASTNLNVPWKGIGVYAGGLLSGLFLAGALLTLPFADLGSAGLKKSLTLFENVLLDIDQGYVEEVDTERLLETAVVSMLRTLDPYTEFQNNQAAADLKETVTGRYGGVGLVISGGNRQQQQQGEQQQQKDGGTGSKNIPEASGNKGGGATGGARGGGVGSSSGSAGDASSATKVDKDGITVVSAFEGYAFDAGMRAGDKITAINGQPVSGVSVDKARDLLRGEPNSKVSISFIRDGINGQSEQEITLTRRLVKLRDVKLAALVGDVQKAPVGYLQLSGFSKGAAQELEQAYRFLDANAKGGLSGVILDLRGNPGGLLEAAVDVSALFVPEGSSIVSIKGRNFQDVTYGSGINPLRPASTPLVVLINGGTASAAEIVSGAVQDLDAGVIVGVGEGRTYGKGLVQNIAELPYNNALKYTVAKYYTPSGRCIQSVNYKEGGVAKGDQPAIAGVGGSGYGYEANEVPEVERKEFLTKHGRVVFDGGGVEADVKVKLPKPSALEIALQVQNAYFDYAGQWTRTHSFKGIPDVATDGMLRDFKNYVLKRQKEGTYNLAAIYGPQLDSLDSVLEASNLKNYDKLVGPLNKKLTKEMLPAFESRKEEIRSSLEEAILSRYLPESMVLRKGLDSDPQFLAGLELVRDRDMYQQILTPADAKLTEDVLRSFGQALKDSVTRGDLRDLRLELAPHDQSTKADVKPAVTPAPEAVQVDVEGK